MEKNDEYVLENYCLWLDNNLSHHLNTTFRIGCTADINHLETTHIFSSRVRICEEQASR